MCGFYIIIDFITEAAGRWKFEHGPQLAPGPDFGHAWPTYTNSGRGIQSIWIAAPTDYIHN